VTNLVKGISKRVVVLRMEECDPFEEAIFIVRGDAGRGVSAHDVVRDAREIVSQMARREQRQRGLWRRLPAPAFAALGAVATALAWVAMRLIGV